MRPVWKGAISFGLVNIPVDLVSAEQKNDLKFNLIDSRDESRIRYERVNEETGEEVPWDQIVKAFEFSDDNYVIVTDEDFARADVKATKTIDIETFIERSELALKYLDRPYYIQPQKGGEKAYTLLRDALIKTDKIAVSRVVIRTRAYLSAIYPEGDVLVLNLIRFHQELRAVEDLKLPGDIKTSKKELDLAVKLINDMTEGWDPSAYHDEYREALMKRIKQKAKGKGIKEEVVEEIAPADNVVDIMDLLQKSIDKGPAKKAKSKTTKKKTS
ncbi:MAG: Ku protein [Tissierellia bacterium]|nr:Ku protein [Tissierellia bacterium]